MESFYVTTPIYYVNDKPHIGHAYTTILADVLARFHRLLGVPTHFLTGTDEHGQKVYEAASAAGIEPLEQADRTVVRFRDLWSALGISNDDFTRTTEPRHTEVVQEILADLWERGEIYRSDYEGWYSVSEERFYTEKDLVDGKTPEGNAVEKIVEPNYFFRMSRYQDWLIEHIEANPEFIQPDFRRNETLGFLRKPLGDLCISRPKKRLPWGIELPFDCDYVCYVWFDALVNYVSAIGYRRDDETFGRWWPATYHLIGKDILTTHTVYWPTMLRAMGLEQPRTIFAHGWWLSGDTKMSKSLGNVVDPMEMIDRHGVDAFRYFLMAEMTLGQDCAFTEDLFVTRYNTDLANDLGNFTSRVAKMIHKNFDGVLPEAGDAGPDEQALAATATKAAVEVEGWLESIRIDRCMASILEVVRAGNRYFDQVKPWAVAKEGDRARLGTILYTGAECLRIVSGLLWPVLPNKMAELRRAIGLLEDELVPEIDALKSFGRLEAGRALGATPTLFPRVDRRATDDGGAGGAKSAKSAKGAKKGKRGGAVSDGGAAADGVGSAKAKAKAKAADAKAAAEGVALVDFDTFGKIDLRTARVTTAERVEGTDKLLRLELDVGGEERQIVAGVAQHYDPEALVGRTIVIVANLKPAKIRGVRSNGMLLAAKVGDTLRLLTTDGVIDSGASVG